MKSHRPKNKKNKEDQRIQKLAKSRSEKKETKPSKANQGQKPNHDQKIPKNRENRLTKTKIKEGQSRPKTLKFTHMIKLQIILRPPGKKTIRTLNSKS